MESQAVGIRNPNQGSLNLKLRQTNIISNMANKNEENLPILVLALQQRLINQHETRPMMPLLT